MKLRQGKQSSQARSIGYVLSVPSRPEQIIDEWPAGDPSMSDVVENRSRAGARTAIIREANTESPIEGLRSCRPMLHRQTCAIEIAASESLGCSLVKSVL
jgi:hypothetical protein